MMPDDDDKSEKAIAAATTESEFTDFLRAYTNDAHGNRVLVGLTSAETEELQELKRAWLRNHMSNDPAPVYSSNEERHAAKTRHSELSDKHERARLQVLGAESQLKNSKPTIN